MGCRQTRRAHWSRPAAPRRILTDRFDIGDARIEVKELDQQPIGGRFLRRSGSVASNWRRIRRDGPSFFRGVCSDQHGVWLQCVRRPHTPVPIRHFVGCLRRHVVSAASIATSPSHPTGVTSHVGNGGTIHVRAMARLEPSVLSDWGTPRDCSSHPTANRLASSTQGRSRESRSPAAPRPSYVASRQVREAP